jgi:hypothetical protein
MLILYSNPPYLPSFPLSSFLPASRVCSATIRPNQNQRKRKQKSAAYILPYPAIPLASATAQNKKKRSFKAQFNLPAHYTRP